MQALNTAILITFTALVLAGSLRTLYRVYEYRAAQRTIPQLLIRDVISRNTLAFSFIMVLVVRALEIGQDVAGQIWWTLVTSVPAIVGAAVYAYYEFFVIDTARGIADEMRTEDLAEDSAADAYDVSLHWKHD